MEAAEARPSLHLSRCQIVGNLMPRLIYLIALILCESQQRPLYLHFREVRVSGTLKTCYLFYLGRTLIILMVLSLHKLFLVGYRYIDNSED